jgi:Predicted permease
VTQTSELKRQAIFWTGALLAFGLLLWTFSSILLPFVVGMAIAYFLDPIADRLERAGLPRLAATLVILVSFVLVIALALVAVIPVLVGQLHEFSVRAPAYIGFLQEYVISLQDTVLPDWAKSQLGAVKDNLHGMISQGVGVMVALGGQLWASGKAMVDIGSLLVVTPVVAFYVLLDWDRMIAKVDSWVPRNHLNDVRAIAVDMDTAIAGFIRGQGSLCLILSVFYAVALSVVGLNFGLLIGFFVGMISFIPYVGSIVGLVLAIGVALVQFWNDPIWIGVILGIFVFGQFVEGNILQPKLVGESVGLHPVWLMFALFAFGLLFGFVGLMVAVPAAAAVGVLVRYGLTKYLDSDIYHGRKTSADAPADISAPPVVDLPSAVVPTPGKAADSPVRKARTTAKAKSTRKPRAKRAS